MLTREAPGAVLVSAEVVVLVPSGEGQGEATGREGGGAQFAGHRWRELQAVGGVFTAKVDGELQGLSVALPVLQLHSQAAATVPEDAMYLLQAQPELTCQGRGQSMKRTPRSVAPSSPLCLRPAGNTYHAGLQSHLCRLPKAD